MSLARDFSQFADQVNADLDGIVNDMAASSARVDAVEADVKAVRDEKNELLQSIFGKLGAISQSLEKVGAMEKDMATVKRLVTSIHDGHVGDMRDVRYRLGVLEAKAVNATHPAEEVTPRPGPSFPR